jgi:hypothetical protein
MLTLRLALPGPLPLPRKTINFLNKFLQSAAAKLLRFASNDLWRPAEGGELDLQNQ